MIKKPNIGGDKIKEITTTKKVNLTELQKRKEYLERDIALRGEWGDEQYLDLGREIARQDLDLLKETLRGVNDELKKYGS